MRVRTLRAAVTTAVAAGTVGASLFATPPASAEVQCTGSASNPATRFCLVSVETDNAIPVFTVTDIVKIESFCLLNACTTPQYFEAPLLDLNPGTVVSVWWNNTCLTINGNVGFWTDPQPKTSPQVCPAH
ncbi:MAG TPA: hypothetical protein VFQ85_09845 [Mycobacteriales bacterium]|jgi:hypothetical protein|nr:hypothetical protein [Mycobacteriales bacterium]